MSPVRFWPSAPILTEGLRPSDSLTRSLAQLVSSENHLDKLRYVRESVAHSPSLYHAGLRPSDSLARTGLRFARLICLHRNVASAFQNQSVPVTVHFLDGNAEEFPEATAAYTKYGLLVVTATKKRTETIAVFHCHSAERATITDRYGTYLGTVVCK